MMPEKWTYLRSYAAWRSALLNCAAFCMLVRLGPRAFRTSLWDLNIVLLIMTHGEASCSQRLRGIDVADSSSTDACASSLVDSHTPIAETDQHDLRGDPDAIITMEALPQGEPMTHFATCYQGTSTGDNLRYVCFFWEPELSDNRWVAFQGPSHVSIAFAGREHVVNKQLFETTPPCAAIRGREAWDRAGVAIARVGSQAATLYSGEKFSNTVPVIVPTEERWLPALWSFCTSTDFREKLRARNKSLSIDNGYIEQVPFDLEHWRSVAEEQYPDGLPERYSEDPTQWIFQGTVRPSTAPLQIAVARLLGYRWPEQADDELDDLVDDDGIVCIPSVRREQPAAVRLQQLLARAYGEAWKPGLAETLLAEVGYQGKTLDDWLQDGCFQQHCELFHQRPFIWHIWDGRRKDGFHVLVNYQQLDRKRLEMLTYTYLGDWIRRQQEELKQEKGGAEGRLEAAKDLQRRLELILEGEAPHDIFVRWKRIEEQSIGWDPDLNDGVRLNIRPFMEADVLRKKPKIHWRKDRGKDPEDSPWYHLFEGNRINDHHLTLEEKHAVRKIEGPP